MEYEWSELFDLYDRAYDLSQDGMVDIKDLLVLIECWGQDEPRADVAPAPSGNGVVDDEDLAVLMEHWGQAVSDPTVTAHWAFDEAEDTTAFDNVSGNDASVMGGPSWCPNDGAVDGAIELDAVDDYVISGYVLNPAEGPFSVFAWIKGGMPG